MKLKSEFNIVQKFFISNSKNNGHFICREVKKYIALNDILKKNYEEIVERYADVIGHQNPKQRIKHVIRLKDKNYELEQVCGIVPLFGIFVISSLAFCFLSILYW